jgi:hypothetical protein
VTTSEVLAAAANRIEDGASEAEDAAAAMVAVAPDAVSAARAIRFFSRFVRSDGIAWEREPGRTKDEVVRALRDAAKVAS